MSLKLTWLSPKDPDEIEDFVCDWTARLAPSDTIASSIWLTPAEINVNSTSFTNNGSLYNGTTTISNRYYTTIWLSGGTLGDTYELVNRITTTGGRSYDQTCKLKMKTR
jgi:hypothetical protein